MADERDRQPRRSLKIDLAELDLAFDTHMDEGGYYLDADTGAIEFIGPDLLYDLRALVDEEGDEDEGSERFEEALEQREYPQSEKEALRVAYRIRVEEDPRYVRIPTTESRDGYQDMEDFIETVNSERLQELLSTAIAGKGAFRRFKDALARYPDQMERWYSFKGERTRSRVLEWLEDEGIEPLGPLGQWGTMSGLERSE